MVCLGRCKMTILYDGMTIKQVIYNMEMQAITEEKELPRFTKEFIGMGHELERRKRERRQVESEERALANRVLFLEKEELKAQRSFNRKREELRRILSIQERQSQEREIVVPPTCRRKPSMPKSRRTWRWPANKSDSIANDTSSICSRTYR